MAFPVLRAYESVHVGAIAGLLGGAFALLSRVLGGLIGLFPFLYLNLESGKIIIEDITSQILVGLAQQFFINMIWGIILGVIYAKVYNLVPGKGIKKGIIYGMIFFLVASFRLSIYLFLVRDFDTAWQFFFIGFFFALFYGLFLGLLYRKPAEPSSLEKEDIQMVKMVKRIHCNASIPKVSKYCKECSKKQ